MVTAVGRQQWDGGSGGMVAAVSWWQWWDGGSGRMVGPPSYRCHYPTAASGGKVAAVRWWQWWDGT